MFIVGGIIALLCVYGLLTRSYYNYSWYLYLMKMGRGSAIMELGMLIMPYCVKITYEIDENDDWLEGLDTINDFYG